jgi:hypothetical protein
VTNRLTAHEFWEQWQTHIGDKPVLATFMEFAEAYAEERGKPCVKQETHDFAVRKAEEYLKLLRLKEIQEQHRAEKEKATQEYIADLERRLAYHIRLNRRAAELLTRHIIVAPAGYDQDVKKWLRDFENRET